MPTSEESLQTLAQALIGRQIPAADAPAVAKLLSDLRQGLAALPHQPLLQPAYAFNPLANSKEGKGRG